MSLAIPHLQDNASLPVRKTALLSRPTCQGCLSSHSFFKLSLAVTASHSGSLWWDSYWDRSYG